MFSIPRYASLAQKLIPLLRIESQSVFKQLCNRALALLAHVSQPTLADQELNREGPCGGWDRPAESRQRLYALESCQPITP